MRLSMTAFRFSYAMGVDTGWGRYEAHESLRDGARNAPEAGAMAG